MSEDAAHNSLQMSSSRDLTDVSEARDLTAVSEDAAHIIIYKCRRLET